MIDANGKFTFFFLRNPEKAREIPIVLWIFIYLQLFVIKDFLCRLSILFSRALGLMRTSRRQFFVKLTHFLILALVGLWIENFKNTSDPLCQTTHYQQQQQRRNWFDLMCLSKNIMMESHRVKNFKTPTLPWNLHRKTQLFSQSSTWPRLLRSMDARCTHLAARIWVLLH